LLSGLTQPLEDATDAAAIEFGERISEALIARDAERETIIVFAVVIDSETDEIIDESSRTNDAHTKRGGSQAEPTSLQALFMKPSLPTNTTSNGERCESAVSAG
jgi:hypothetical protein